MAWHGTKCEEKSQKYNFLFSKPCFPEDPVNDGGCWKCIRRKGDCRISNVRTFSPPIADIPHIFFTISITDVIIIVVIEIYFIGHICRGPLFNKVFVQRFPICASQSCVKTINFPRDQFCKNCLKIFDSRTNLGLLCPTLEGVFVAWLENSFDKYFTNKPPFQQNWTSFH